MSAQSQNGRHRDEHLDEDTIEKYRSHRLVVDELRAADRHLSGCGSCRRVLLARLGPVRLPDEITDLPEPLHLSYEHITAYVDNALSGADKERAEAHLFLCASCSREIAEVRKLDARLAAPAAEVKAGGRASEPREALGARLARFFAAPGRMREFGVALGAIVVGFLLFQAGHGPSAVSRTAARFIHFSADSQDGLNIGGCVLVIVGTAYVLYSLFRKR